MIRLNPDETLTMERVKHYLSITEKARAKATSLASTPDEETMLKTLLSMADDYANDAQYFLDQGTLSVHLEPSITLMLGLMQALSCVY